MQNKKGRLTGGAAGAAVNVFFDWGSYRWVRFRGSHDFYWIFNISKCVFIFLQVYFV